MLCRLWYDEHGIAVLLNGIHRVGFLAGLLTSTRCAMLCASTRCYSGSAVGCVHMLPCCLDRSAGLFHVADVIAGSCLPAGSVTDAESPKSPPSHTPLTCSAVTSVLPEVDLSVNRTIHGMFNRRNNTGICTGCHVVLTHEGTDTSFGQQLSNAAIDSFGVSGPHQHFIDKGGGTLAGV
jgi:hypothetical protein